MFTKENLLKLDKTLTKKAQKQRDTHGGVHSETADMGNLTAQLLKLIELIEEDS